MLYSEIIAVCSQIHIKHTKKKLCGHNVGFLNVNHGGTYSNHSALKGKVNYKEIHQATALCIVSKRYFRCSTYG
jgi:hypothetical protein